MAALPKEKPIIRFSPDEMEAYMLLPSPDEGEEYTVPYVMQALSERGVNAGIDHEEIARMVVEEVFEREVLIARGAQPVDGVVILNINSAPVLIINQGQTGWFRRLLVCPHDRIGGRRAGDRNLSSAC